MLMSQQIQLMKTNRFNTQVKLFCKKYFKYNNNNEFQFFQRRKFKIENKLKRNLDVNTVEGRQ